MFVGFSINDANEFSSKKFIDYYNSNISTRKDSLKIKRILGQLEYDFSNELEEFIIGKEGLSGKKIEDNWFPDVDADIFISHSHKDIELANKLSDFFLEEFGLNCFIDSNVWKYAPDLLTKINDKYSDKQVTKEHGTLYNHEKSNLASQHVNIMLATALHKMIDKTEMVILLDTPNSLCNVDDIYHKAQTYSPWIYSEAICTQIVRHKELYMYRGGKEAGNICEAMMHYDGGLMVKYDFSTEHLMSLTFDDLLKWAKLWKEKRYEHSHGGFTEPLDYLYIYKKIIRST